MRQYTHQSHTSTSSTLPPPPKKENFFTSKTPVNASPHNNGPYQPPHPFHQNKNPACTHGETTTYAKTSLARSSKPSLRRPEPRTKEERRKKEKGPIYNSRFHPHQPTSQLSGSRERARNEERSMRTSCLWIDR